MLKVVFDRMRHTVKVVKTDPDNEHAQPEVLSEFTQEFLLEATKDQVVIGVIEEEMGKLMRREILSMARSEK